MDNRLRILQLILGVFILLVIIYRIGIHELFSILVNINIFYLPLILFVFSIIFFIYALNLKILFSPIAKLPFWRILRFYLLSWSIGVFTPAKVGEFSMIYFLSKEGIAIGDSAAVLTLDRMITLATLWIFSVYSISLFFRTDILMFIGLSIVAWSMGLFIIFSNVGRDIVKKFVLRSHQKIFTGFSKTLFEYIKNSKSILALTSVLVIIRWFVFALTTYLILLSFGHSTDILKLFSIIVASIIVGLIPLSINGLGIREGAFIFLASKIGIETTIAASATLTFTAITYTLAFAINFFMAEKLLKSRQGDMR